MKNRTAILRAADHIESSPQDYNYDLNCKPVCGTPGCMLGWIGKFLRMKRVDANDEQISGYTSAVARRLGHGGLSEFLGIATNISRTKFGSAGDHQLQAKAAADVLRIYADRFHPESSAYSGASK